MYILDVKTGEFFTGSTRYETEYFVDGAMIVTVPSVLVRNHEIVNLNWHPTQRYLKVSHDNHTGLTTYQVVIWFPNFAMALHNAKSWGSDSIHIFEHGLYSHSVDVNGDEK